MSPAMGSINSGMMGAPSFPLKKDEKIIVEKGSMLKECLTYSDEKVEGIVKYNLVAKRKEIDKSFKPDFYDDEYTFECFISDKLICKWDISFCISHHVWFYDFAISDDELTKYLQLKLIDEIYEKLNEVHTSPIHKCKTIPSFDEYIRLATRINIDKFNHFVCDYKFIYMDDLLDELDMLTQKFIVNSQCKILGNVVNVYDHYQPEDEKYSHHVSITEFPTFIEISCSDKFIQHNLNLLMTKIEKFYQEIGKTFRIDQFRGCNELKIDVNFYMLDYEDCVKLHELINDFLDQSVPIFSWNVRFNEFNKHFHD